MLGLLVYLQLADLQATVVHAVVPQADVDVLTQRALGPLQPKSERV